MSQLTVAQNMQQRSTEACSTISQVLFKDKYLFKYLFEIIISCGSGSRQWKRCYKSLSSVCFQYICPIQFLLRQIFLWTILNANNINRSNFFTGEILAVSVLLSPEVKTSAHPGSEALPTSLNTISFHKQILLLSGQRILVHV